MTQYSSVSGTDRGPSATFSISRLLMLRHCPNHLFSRMAQPGKYWDEPRASLSCPGTPRRRWQPIMTHDAAMNST